MAQTLRKTDLIDALITEMQLSRAQARELVELFFEHIRQNLEQGEHVKLSGFGNFILRDKAERTGRNPKTKVEASIAARRVVTFKPGVKLKEKVKA